jgi:hypothetical protein
VSAQVWAPPAEKDANVSAETDTSALPLFPPEVAVTVVVPAPTPVTTPLADTVATEDSVEAQVMVRPVRGLPDSSVTVAVNVCDSPASSVNSPGSTETDPTATKMTDTVALPLFPSELAVIVAEPSPTPVTKPVVETVATASSVLAQTTERPARGLPD